MTERPPAERVARAICKAMNIDPDGRSDANRFNRLQDRRFKRKGVVMLETMTNWQAAQHVALAAMAAAMMADQPAAQ